MLVQRCTFKPHCCGLVQIGFASKQNDTAAAVTRQTLDIAAKGVMAIVLGGIQADIANAMVVHKPLGVAMSGDVSVTDSGTYQAVDEVPIKIALTIEHYRHLSSRRNHPRSRTIWSLILKARGAEALNSSRRLVFRSERAST